MNEVINLPVEPRLHVERDAEGHTRRVLVNGVDVTGICISATSRSDRQGTETLVFLRSFTPRVQRVPDRQEPTV